MKNGYFEKLNLTVSDERVDLSKALVRTLKDDPQLVVKIGKTAEDLERRTQEIRFIELTWALSEKYGLHNPGFGGLMAGLPGLEHATLQYTSAERVNGVNLSSGLCILSQPELLTWTPKREFVDYDSVRQRMRNMLPLEVAISCFEGILQYYQDTASQGGYYLTDVRPNNIVYGATRDEATPRLHFVDFDPEHVDYTYDAPPHQLVGIRNCCKEIERLLPEVEELYSVDVELDGLRSQIADLKSSQSQGPSLSQIWYQ